MEDRIQINGIWYVREDKVDVDKSLEEYMQNNVVTYQCMAFENFKWVFEAHAYSDSNELDTIKIENKMTGKKELWDSLSFIKSFNPSAYPYESDDTLTKEGAKLMHYFINEVKKKGWLE